MICELGIKKQGAKENTAKFRKFINSNDEKSLEVIKMDRISKKIKKMERKNRKNRINKNLLNCIKDELNEFLLSVEAPQDEIFKQIRYS